MGTDGEHLDSALLQRRSAEGGTEEEHNGGEVVTGEIIEAQLTHATAPAFSVLHKQEGAGCLHPAECWPICACLCPVLKRRTFNWIGENAIMKNTPVFLIYWPFSCSFCITEDYTRMKLLDQHPFHPCCRGLGSPCGAIGYATEEDLCDCFCTNCRGPYKRFLRPCFGEVLLTVPCENASRGFKISTQLCLVCFMFPVGLCLADSKTYRMVLMKQVAHSQGKELTDNQTRALAATAPQIEEMAR